MRSPSVWMFSLSVLFGCSSGRAEALAPPAAPLMARPKEPVLAEPQVAPLPPPEGSQADAEAPSKLERLAGAHDVEARLRIETDQVEASGARLRALCRSFGGHVTEATITSDPALAPAADLVLRLPADQLDAFLAELGKSGRVLSQTVQSKEISKEYFDAELRLQTLEQSRRQYQKLLEQAANLAEAALVSERLEELVLRIEELKGELAYLRARGSLATVHVSLVVPESQVPSWDTPEATLYPGVRLSYARILGGSPAAADFVGPGLSLRFSRYFSLDVEGLPDAASNYEGSDFDLILVTMGGELYSDFLGGGKRKYLNPYLGVRGGFASFLGQSEIVLGGTIGLELVQLKELTLDLDLRSYAMFADGAETHGILQPALGLSVAF